MGAKPTSSVDPKVLAAVRAAFPWSQSQGAAVTLGAVVYSGACHPEPLVTLPVAMTNRHGLIAGATGTGKTKTLQLIAEQLSAAGVPVFMADLKGDLSGVAAPVRPTTRSVSAQLTPGTPGQPMVSRWSSSPSPASAARSFGRPCLRSVPCCSPGYWARQDPGERAVAGLQILRRSWAAAARPSRPADGSAVPDGEGAGDLKNYGGMSKARRRRAVA